MKVAYGVDIKNVWDERIDIIDEAFIGLRELTVPIQTLLEFLPIFGRLPKWVPGLGFVRTLTRSQAPNHHLVHTEFDEAKADVVCVACTCCGRESRGAQLMCVRLNDRSSAARVGPL